MSNIRPRDRLKREIVILLGGSIVRTELGDEELNLAIDMALDRYRQRSGNSMEDSYVVMTLDDQQTYQLPPEVMIVKDVLRTGYGQFGTQEPFSLAFVNQMYYMNSPSGMGSPGSTAGFLSTFDMSAQYSELSARMFGRDMQFHWNAQTKRIQFVRKPIVGEEILLEVRLIKPEDVIIDDFSAKGWIRGYSMAQAKMIVGQARSKFAQLAGPQGGVTLNGSDLIAQATAEIEKLDVELENLVDANKGMPFIIG